MTSAGWPGAPGDDGRPDPYASPSASGEPSGAAPYPPPPSGAQPYGQPYGQPSSGQPYDQAYGQPYAQQPYAQQPYGQPYPTYVRSPQQEKNSLGIIALVLGLVSFMGFGPLTAIPAIIVGVSARRAAAEGRADNGGLGTAAIWIGVVVLVATLAVVAGFVLLVFGFRDVAVEDAYAALALAAAPR